LLRSAGLNFMPLSSRNVVVTPVGSISIDTVPQPHHPSGMRAYDRQVPVRPRVGT
jgi:hypothetical protein